MPQQYGITDRIKFSVIKVNTNQIITNDLLYSDAQVMVNLSGPSRCTIKIPQPEQYRSAAGIDWKTWGYWLIPEIGVGGQRKFLGAQLVNKVNVDPKSGELLIEGLGFMGYPKGIPWLENYNPIAVDPAEVIQRIWAHVQNYTNANLGVEVYPASTGTQMLPGYSFDGTELVFDFFAMFIRAVDFQDCGDIITSLARDLPLDMLEEVTWTGTLPTKKIHLGYKFLGLKQTALEFIQGENVIHSEKAEETDIEPVTDVIIRGWRPGSVYSSTLNIETVNEELVQEGKPQIVADPLERVRRVIMEEDANIDSTERAQAWARRRLTRRNIPKSFKTIIVDPNHPNAPIDNWWLADTVYVKAENYPWYGTIEGWHRITSITFKSNELLVEIGLKVDGAFNYDPIKFEPNWQDKPTTDTNLLSNGYFSGSLAGWLRLNGQWIRISNDGYRNLGCVRVDCDDTNEILESHRVPVNPGGTYNFSAWVKRQTMEFESNINTAVDGIFIAYKTYNNGTLLPVVPTAQRKTNWTRIAGISTPQGTGPWTELQGSITIPANVNEVSLVLCVTKVTGGITWWDDARIDPYNARIVN